MKAMIALMAIFSFSHVYADAYKAPKFKLPKAQAVEAKTQKAHWDDESHFKIEESPEAERDLASSPDREAEWAKPNEPVEP